MVQGDPRTELAVVRPLLIDTGPFVAYLSRRDSSHKWATSAIDAVTSPTHTTSAVVTEVTHFVSAEGTLAFARMLSGAGTVVQDFAQSADLGEATELMIKYSDVPMDYADATLLLLAERLGVYDILT